MTMDDDKDYRRFLDLLPWHLNGTLSVEDARWMQSYIDGHSLVTSDLEFEALLSDQMANAVASVPSSVGRDRLMEKLRQEEGSARHLGKVTMNAGGLGAQVRDFLGVFTAPRLAWGMSIIAAIQFGFIYDRLRDQQNGDTSEYRSLGSRNLPVLRVKFQETATERDISRLLVQADAVIVGGPSQLGEYEVISRSQDFEGLRAALKQSAIVEFVANKSD